MIRTPFADRLARLRAAMARAEVQVTLLSVGADLPYFTGYEAMPLERLTMLVVTAEDTPVLFVPRLEAPRVAVRDDAFALRPWGETEDPVALVAEMVGSSAERVAIGDQTWARFVIGLERALPAAEFGLASRLTAPLRALKDPAEVEALRSAAAAADRVAAALRGGEIALVGRTEADIAAEIGARLRAEGHYRVNFVIVAGGASAASPHHEPGASTIEAGTIVLCDFGGSRYDEFGVGYCSDITRCVHVGEPPADIADAYAALRAAQASAVATGVAGRPCHEVDATARGALTEAGYGEYFIHRTGHGIGVETHEEPYVVEGSGHTLEAGNAFSVEPGIYLPHRWGMRLEDIVVAGESAPDVLNRTDRDLAIVEG